MGEIATQAPVKVAVFGTGKVGGHALRAVRLRSDFELVAARVYTDAKVGRDVGELIGDGPYGVAASADVAGVLEAQPDAVLYMPNTPNLDDICALLEAGVDVISTSGGQMFYPYHDAELAGRLERACAAGQSSFSGAGVDPGYMSSVLPLSLASWCRRIDRIRMTEVALMVDYPSATTLFDLMHFGHPLDPENCRKGPVGERIGRSFGAQVTQLAAGLGATLDRIDFQYEEAAAPRRLEVAAGVVEAGTVAGERWLWSGIVDGAPLVEIEVNWILAHDLPGWPGGFGWRIDIEGDPDLHLTLETGGGDDSDEECCIATAMNAVNALPHVVASGPGVLSALDLGLVTGKYVGRASHPRSADSEVAAG